MEQVEYMIKDISIDEIERALFSLANNKALGLDGYNALFFKKTWSTVGDDVVEVMQSFFTSVGF